MGKKTFKTNNPKPGSHSYNLIGTRFGMLTVLEHNGSDKHKNKIWLCKCDCGNTCLVKTSYLNSGKTKSCKCNQYKKGKYVYNYNGYEDITGTKWNSIINNAKNRSLEFFITKEDVWDLYLKQNKK